MQGRSDLQESRPRRGYLSAPGDQDKFNLDNLIHWISGEVLADQTVRTAGDAAEPVGSVRTVWALVFDACILVRLIIRHAILSILFVLLYLALNQPPVILISQLGSVAVVSGHGPGLAVLLGVSPWYALLVCFADALAGALIYHQPLLSFGETLGSLVSPPVTAQRPMFCGVRCELIWDCDAVGMSCATSL